MTSTSGSAPARRTGTGGSDPASLVADIERTRDDLAETLEEIVDRVSPKRVAARTQEKVSVKVKEGVQTAREGATTAAETVKAKMAELRSGSGPGSGSGSLKQRADAARAAALQAAEAARARVTAARSGGAGTSTGVGGSVAITGAPEGLPPVDGREVPALPVGDPVTATGPTTRVTYPSGSSSVPKEFVAGGVAALVFLLLLRRRRR